MNNISLLIGLKNNLEYSKNFYYTTRALYPDIEIVFTSYNSTDGTHDWLDSLTDNNLIYFYSKENKTFSDTFNKCTQLATQKMVVFAHNDMVLSPGFIENLSKHVSDKNVVYYTTIEPPVFADDERPGKIIKDFGMDIASLKIDKLYTFSNKIQSNNPGDTNSEQRVSFFLCVNKEILLNIGGLDPLYNPMFCEDDDLILRFKLLGLNIVTSLNAICYHFVSKTSRFSEEYQAKTQQIELNSNKNFVRKWGFKNSSPVKKKYDIGLVVKNANEELLAKLEPWCCTIYIDCKAENYINKEQSNTLFNLHDRIKSYNSPKTNDILISFDGNKLNDKTYHKIQQLNEIITQRINKPLTFFEKLIGKSNTTFKLKMLKFQILKTSTYENQFIVNTKNSLHVF